MKNITKLYADDTKILSKINTDLCIKEIKNDIDRAFKCTED